MTKMVSLAQRYGDFDKPASAASDEYYPSIYLDKKLLDALDVENSRVGTELTMVATVRVTNLSEGEQSRSMTLEIREAAISPKEKKPDAASVLFPNDKAG